MDFQCFATLYKTGESKEVKPELINKANQLISALGWRTALLFPPLIKFWDYLRIYFSFVVYMELSWIGGPEETSQEQYSSRILMKSSTSALEICALRLLESILHRLLMICHT